MIEFLPCLTPGPVTRWLRSIRKFFAPTGKMCWNYWT